MLEEALRRSLLESKFGSLSPPAPQVQPLQAPSPIPPISGVRGEGKADDLTIQQGGSLDVFQVAGVQGHADVGTGQDDGAEEDAEDAEEDDELRQAILLSLSSASSSP